GVSDGLTNLLARSEVRMPWGKFAGQPMRDVPSKYLVWFIEDSDTTEALRQAARRELGVRFGMRPVVFTLPGGDPVTPPPWTAEEVAAFHEGEDREEECNP